MRVWAVMASLLPLARAGPGDTLQQLTNAVTNIRYEDQVRSRPGVGSNSQLLMYFVRFWAPLWRL